jgi:hypothetical protein
MPVIYSKRVSLCKPKNRAAKKNRARTEANLEVNMEIADTLGVADKGVGMKFVAHDLWYIVG